MFINNASYNNKNKTNTTPSSPTSDAFVYKFADKSTSKSENDAIQGVNKLLNFQDSITNLLNIAKKGGSYVLTPAQERYVSKVISKFENGETLSDYDNEILMNFSRYGRQTRTGVTGMVGR